MYEYLLNRELMHSLFLLLSACEDHKEALPEAVAKAYDGVQQSLQGGIRFLAGERQDYHA